MNFWRIFFYKLYPKIGVQDQGSWCVIPDLIFVYILVLRVALVYGYVSSECELLNVLHLYCICMAFTLCLCCICIEYAWLLHCICVAP